MAASARVIDPPVQAHLRGKTRGAKHGHLSAAELIDEMIELYSSKAEMVTGVNTWRNFSWNHCLPL